MSKKVLNFYPEKPEYSKIFDEPLPAKKLIPEWYKSQDKYVDGIKSINKETGQYSVTIKGCMPVFDMITSGYIITTPADIHVSQENGEANFSWAVNGYTCIESHSQAQYDKYNIPKEFVPVGYKFINPWRIETPKGYSSMFVTPTFRDDLPFECLPAIVDTDKHPIAVNFPFFLRKDFSGIIPAGTPMIQVIPFKREGWKHEVKDYEPSSWIKWKKAENKIANRYKEFFRSAKEWD